MVDALDEAGKVGRNPLVEMLARNAQRLPDWLGLVVTSRPEFDVKTPLQALNPFPLDTQSESNRSDIRDYLRRELGSQLQSRQDTDRLVEQILGMSEGVFLDVERLWSACGRLTSAVCYSSGCSASAIAGCRAASSWTRSSVTAEFITTPARFPRPGCASRRAAADQGGGL